MSRALAPVGISTAATRPGWISTVSSSPPNRPSPLTQSAARPPAVIKAKTTAAPTSRAVTVPFSRAMGGSAEEAGPSGRRLVS